MVAYLNVIKMGFTVFLICLFVFVCFVQAKTKTSGIGGGAGAKERRGKWEVQSDPRCRPEQQLLLFSGPKNKNSLIGLHSSSLLWTCGLDPENNCSL